MTSEEIRPIIDCFCQILSSYGFSMITTEIFYLAKFDQNQATIPLWKLIYEMIQFDKQEYFNKNFDQLPKNEIVNRIKSDLYQRGYTYEQFLLLDNQMKTGSRQLLVCLGWLIYHIKFIEKCFNSIVNFDQKDDLIEQIKQIKNANIKIRSRLQTIEYLNSKENFHLSSFETQLCQYPHLISQYLIELNYEDKNLNLFLYWNKHENLFWKWMESVLDQPILYENKSIVYQYFEAEKQKFNAAIDTLDSVLIQLEQICLSNDDHASIKTDISSIITTIDMQISSLFNQLLNNNKISF